MHTRRHVSLAAGAAILAGSAAGPAIGAGYPDRPIRVVVPFAAGGNVDTVARLLAPQLAERLGQPVVVDNRPGAGGSIGAEAVARAAPDGYTLLAGSNGPLTVNVLVQARLPYDPSRAFAPIGLAGRAPLVLAVAPAVPARDLAELLALSRTRPGAVTVGTPGNGSTGHLALELFNATTRAGLVHVPYRGGGAVVPDLLAGAVAAMFAELSTALPLHREGRARILAVAAERRSPALPEAPTFAEAGAAGILAASYVGLLAPSGTPPEAVQRVGAALLAALSHPPVRDRLADLGLEPAAPDEARPDGFAAFLGAELDRARRAAASAGLRPE